MPTPGFGPGSLDELGCPVWVRDLAVADPNHVVHVVRDLEPAEALELLGADRQAIAPCELPAVRSDEGWISLPLAALQARDPAADPFAVLLAGRIGDWTFVYDDGGPSRFLPRPDQPPLISTRVLSEEGGTAATAYHTIQGRAGFLYAVEGELRTYQEVYALDDLEAATPAEVRAAFEAAGSVGVEFDECVSMRAICVLADLPRTLDGFRAAPLLVAPLDRCGIPHFP